MNFMLMLDVSKDAFKVVLVQSVVFRNAIAGEGVSLHFFPKEPKLRQTWSVVLRLGKAIPKFGAVCSHHFQKTDFKNIHAKKKYLKSTAIPSQKIPKRKCSPSSSQKKQKRAKAEERRIRSVRRCLNFENAVPVIDSSRDIEAAKMLLLLSSAPPRIKTAETQTTKINSPEMKYAQTQTTKIIPVHQLNNRLLDSIRTKEQLTSLTGINSFQGFHALCDAVISHEESGGSSNNSLAMMPTSRVLMTLMKLKLALSFTSLSAFFLTTREICSREFKRTVCTLRVVLQPCIMWLSKKTIQENMPRSFASFTSTRIILDCTEFPVFSWKCLNCRNQTYSHYKGRHTLKFMIGITPSGVITFVSPLYGGKSSDKFIFNDSGILNQLESGDSIMVDRGFFVERECEGRNVRVIRPAFMKPHTSQLSLEDAEYSRTVASVRVHVERSIQRLKNYKILHEEVPHHLIEVIPDIVIIVCGLVNLSAPILSDNKF